MTGTPRQIWWTAAEIAEAKLTDLPSTRQGVEMLAKRLGWRGEPNHSRRRQGRGGGWEYHWRLFPLAAVKHLIKAGAEVEVLSTEPTRKQNRTEAWSWFDSLPDGDKSTAQRRLKIIQTVEMVEASGVTRNLSVTETAHMVGVSPRTIWNWLSLIEGVAVEDRLAYLVPGYRAANRVDAATLSIGSQDWWEVLKADYLRRESRVPFASAYRRSVRIAKDNGWDYLPERTAKRRMDALVPRVSQVLAREGIAGLERRFPPQVRDRASMVAMEGVNADTHRIDVFVRWEDGTVDRPQIIAFQDIYSGKILSYRVDHSPNKVAVMAAFGDMVHDYGIPRHVLFDNGREFANKWMTGGAPTRFMFKVREDDPLGVLPQMGIEIHWARPAHGQAKPIERAFRDFSLDIALDPRFAGAYTGHKHDAKPENYQSRAVPIDEFLVVLDECVAEHNARPGRRSPTCMGRSFDDTFEASYADAPVRKATEEQQRLWLMGQDVKKLHAKNGRVSLFENVYWSDWMSEAAGQKVILRFDPEDLHAGLYVYSLAGSYLGYAACQQKVGFFSAAAGKEEARRVAAFKRRHKAALEAQVTLSPRDVGKLLTNIERNTATAPEAKVVRPEFGAGRGNGPLIKRHMPTPQIDEAAEARHEAFVATFTLRKAEPQAEETEYDRFRQALTLEERIEAGQGVGEEEKRWLQSYRSQPEYRALARMYEDFGEAMFAE